MQTFGLHDSRRLEAARGWIGLGSLVEAEKELEKISAPMRSHPEVLRVRWQIRALAGEWEVAAAIARHITESVPNLEFGWILHAHSFHQLERTDQAWDVLYSVVDRFPGDAVIRLKLACYASKLGDLKSGRHWLEKAFEVGDIVELRELALEELDLRPLWTEIKKL